MHRSRLVLLLPLFVVAAVVACATGSAAPPVFDTPPDRPHAEASTAESAVTEEASVPPLSEQGAAFIRDRGCPSCHQSPDAADGVLSGQAAPRPGTRAYPANLTPDVDTGIGGWSDEMIARAIRSGVDDLGESLCPTMPRFSNMADEEAFAIVAYLRDLPPIRRKIPPSKCADASVTEQPDAAADGA